MARIRVLVPASAGNLGSAFGTLGLALGLSNEVIVDPSRSSGLEMEGEGAELLAQGEPNLVRRAMDRLAGATGRAIPPHGLRLVNRIPMGRGMGSSAAAIVGGLLAADALADTQLSRLRLLELAASLEGHPDSVAPAIYGGAVLTVENEGGLGSPLTVVPLGVPADWKAVLYVPDLVPPASPARELLPREVPRAQAIQNHGRVGLLVVALAQGRTDFLRLAMEDRLHPPGRAKFFPESVDLIEAALEGGAWGACRCGSGSAVLALASQTKAAGLAETMRRKAVERGVSGRARVFDIPPAGARVEPLD
jgi:homoserine kinase